MRGKVIAVCERQEQEQESSWSTRFQSIPADTPNGERKYRLGSTVPRLNGIEQSVRAFLSRSAVRCPTSKQDATSA